VDLYDILDAIMSVFRRSFRATIASGSIVMVNTIPGPVGSQAGRKSEARHLLPRFPPRIHQLISDVKPVIILTVGRLASAMISETTTTEKWEDIYGARPQPYPRICGDDTVMLQHVDHHVSGPIHVLKSLPFDGKESSRKQDIVFWRYARLASLSL
jgi:hypothetical protein